jgi:hypothetical protein
VFHRGAFSSGKFLAHTRPTQRIAARAPTAPGYDDRDLSTEGHTDPVDQSDTKGSVASNNSEQRGKPTRQVTLRTLAPEYNKDRHDIYVRHLEDGVQDRRNRNIALTGRYGAGKSSVLDAFEKKHEQSTLRISINTLGPDEDDEDLTNRIQKELVKQLIYRLKPGQIRRSRFARPKSLTKWWAFLQAVGASAVGLGILWLLGIRPASGWPDADSNVAAQAGLNLLFFALVVLAVWAARWLIGDRIVSEVTTAGTKIALGDGPTTYFDSFLDEIVQFFDAVEPDYVIFEDLDRFDDPQIFDSLRELNALINSSAHWKAKDQPLRFIYAIKDSLFEQLGTEVQPKDNEPDVDSGIGAKLKRDFAAVGVQRANRTKFFELVIPMVPFISHRNARDLLVKSLLALGFPEHSISRPLLDLIARHTTDMRLMINICNEFAVFAEHLLWSDNPAPGMTTDDLFALVAYKNFHLADFEDISQRTSTLDRLERHHRDQIRTLIEGLQEQRRERLRTEEQRHRKDVTASALGDRLRDIKDLFAPQNGWPFASVTVGSNSYKFNVVDKVSFWEDVAKTKSFSLVQQHSGTVVSLDPDKVDRLFPEVMTSDQWLDPNPRELTRLLEKYDKDIATLRGADFAGLALYEHVPKGQISFDQRIEQELKSELARDLVRKGYITRNYSEYSAVFYGNFVGVDVAFFYNHSVQPNEMYLDYEFTSADAISNLLEQVPADFAGTVSALNIQVVTYLLTERPSDVKQLVTYIVSHDSNDVRAFLDAFTNATDAPRELLFQQLAAHPWRQAFEYVAGHQGIPDHETRLRLFDAILLSTLYADSYEIGESTQILLSSSHAQLTALTEPQTSLQTERIFSIMKAVSLVVPQLNSLSEPLRDHVVSQHMFKITVPNLKLALGINSAPTLDEVRKNSNVWAYCRMRIEDYIEAVREEDSTQHLVLSEPVLVEVISEQHESWTDDALRDIINGSAASAMISDIRTVPQPVWPALVGAGLIAPTADNVSVYVRAHGVDEHLSSFLVPDEDHPTELQDVENVDVEIRTFLAIRILNESAHLTPRSRIQLLGQLDLEPGIELSDVIPSPDQLLARALEAELLPDDLATFAHFAQGGWNAVSEAFSVSSNVAEFMTPALVGGFVTEFLESEQIPAALRDMVVANIDLYIPADDAGALCAAGRHACSSRIWLPLKDIRRIARVTRTADVVLPQLVHASDISPSDLSDILVSLGEPYENLSGGRGTEFDLPTGSSSETLFRRLETAGRIKIVPKVIGRGRKVQILA